MFRTILALSFIALTTNCATDGTQRNAEMEFCWERGMNFQWIEEFDAGCVDPTVQSSAMRISKIKWLEKNRGRLVGHASYKGTRNL